MLLFFSWVLLLACSIESYDYEVSSTTTSIRDDSYATATCNDGDSAIGCSCPYTMGSTLDGIIVSADSCRCTMSYKSGQHVTVTTKCEEQSSCTKNNNLAKYTYTRHSDWVTGSNELRCEENYQMIGCYYTSAWAQNVDFDQLPITQGSVTIIDEIYCSVSSSTRFMLSATCQANPAWWTSNCFGDEAVSWGDDKTAIQDCLAREEEMKKTCLPFEILGENPFFPIPSGVTGLCAEFAAPNGDCGQADARHLEIMTSLENIEQKIDNLRAEVRLHGYFNSYQGYFIGIKSAQNSYLLLNGTTDYKYFYATSGHSLNEVNRDLTAIHEMIEGSGVGVNFGPFYKFISEQGLCSRDLFDTMTWYLVLSTHIVRMTMMALDVSTYKLEEEYKMMVRLNEESYVQYCIIERPIDEFQIRFFYRKNNVVTDRPFFIEFRQGELYCKTGGRLVYEVKQGTVTHKFRRDVVEEFTKFGTCKSIFNFDSTEDLQFKITYDGGSYNRCNERSGTGCSWYWIEVQRFAVKLRGRPTMEWRGLPLFLASYNPWQVGWITLRASTTN